MKIEEIVYEFIKSNNMIKDGEKVLVALSGGPDSICLLHILYTMRDLLKIELYAAHLNHCIRGEFAESDEEYCKQFCGNLSIPFFSKKVKVEDLAKEKGISCELAGREARYSFFDEIKERVGINKIAIAHNANDQAETVLLRMIRGSGIDGLCGIKAVRDEIYIRPILSLNRQSIERYCEDNRLKPHIDKTNLENIYRRNKVRLELLPYVSENFNSDIIGTLNRLAYTMQGEQRLLKKFVDTYYEKYCYKKDNRLFIQKEAFYEDENLVARLIRQAYCDFYGNLNDLAKANIYDVISLSKGETGKYIMLPNGIAAYNNYGDVYMEFRQDDTREEVSEELAKENQSYELIMGEVNKINHMKVTLELIKNENIKLDNNNIYKRYFNYDKIKDSVNLRYRREKDFFNPLGMTGSKSLKKLFIDMKISRYHRDSIPLICFGNDIAWIVGYRVSEKYKVTRETKQILCINFERGIQNDKRY